MSKWKDERNVLWITTEYQPKIVMSKRKYSQKKNVELQKMIKYKECMGGVITVWNL